MTDERTTFSLDDLLACGRGELFSPNSPKLPLPPMLMFDSISEMSETDGEHGKGFARADYKISPDHWYFPCHFEGDPVMPGCLGLDALWQLTGFYLGWLGHEGNGRALSVGEVKFTGMVTPETKNVRYGIDLKRVFKSKLILGVANGFVEADGEIIFKAQDLRVGVFQD